MAELTAPARALAAIARALEIGKRKYALVGGLAVSVRAEVRFTRDVDVVVVVTDDAEAERLVLDLRATGYAAIASVEHETQKRLSTVRLMSPEGVKVDLLFASSGIEAEIAERATVVSLPDIGQIPIARAEELLAMKVLSMRADRPQDRMDAQRLVVLSTTLSLDQVRNNLELVTRRGFNRDENLLEKLDALLAEIKRP